MVSYFLSPVLEDQVKTLVDGIQDEKDENTKLSELLKQKQKNVL